MIKRFSYTQPTNNRAVCADRKVIIYGRGATALHTLVGLKAQSIDVVGFTDTLAENGEKFAGMPVFKLGEIEDIENACIYIAVASVKNKRDILYNIEEVLHNSIPVICSGNIYGAGLYDVCELKRMIDDNVKKIDFIMERLGDEKSKKTFKNLLDYRVSNDRTLLEEIYETTHSQYFPIDGLLKVGDSEVFVDAGGFNGGSTVGFAAWTKGKYKKSIIFEADDLMYEVCCEMIRVKDIRNVEVIKKAAWSKEATLQFDNTSFASGSAKIVDWRGTHQVEGVPIDKELEQIGCAATYIKMDIEGAELEALHGCKNTIANLHPKLAISIYHKWDDLWEIPYYLMGKYPFYKFYMRHYTPITTETILYATE